MADQPEYYRYELSGADGLPVRQTVHRKGHRLYFFSCLDDRTEPLCCSCLFDVHWLPHAYHERRQMDTLDVEYVLSGSLICTCDGSDFLVHEGEILLFSPGCDGIVRTGPEGHCHKVSMAVHGTIMKAYLASSGLPKHAVLSGIDRSYFESLLERLRSLAGEPVSVIQRKNGSLSYELLHFLGHPLAPENVPKWLSDLVHTLEERMEEPWNLEQMSSMVMCSPNHLIRLFTQFYGVTPAKYLRMMRLNASARLLLEQPELSVKMVSARVGFVDQLNFSTAFRRVFGTSPRNYRLQHGILGEKSSS